MIYRYRRTRPSLTFPASAWILIMLGLTAPAVAQQETKWMAVGSLYSWFSSTGCEIEEGRIKPGQQDGLQWPGYYQYEDMEAAKGLWIGATGFKDQNNNSFDYKVVHVGPRVTGSGEFYPVKFEMVSKFDPPLAYVDGALSFGKPVDNNRVDPTLKADRMINNVVNTSLGITMTRKILAWGQSYHDNYYVYEYTFTNTGNVNGDPAIELPSQTLTGVRFYFQYRYAICADTRYVIGQNPTGWGINTMNDTRGDGVKNDPDNPTGLRAQYAWHGLYPPFTGGYDNIGGPIWVPYYDKTDTTGRLGAAQFIGVVTLHADKSPTDTTDDPSQPSTTAYVSSDLDLNSQNDQFDNVRMRREYTTLMNIGHMSPRHADVVQANGQFDVPTGDPALGTSGGFSSANGYGPYTLAPGQSVRIVIAEGAAGLSRAACISVGRKFKAKTLDAKSKNDSVFTGRDSLFQTFRRAIANYNSGYNIPAGPAPPSVFNVTSGGDKVTLSWDVSNAADPNLKGFRIYRATGRYDGDYTLIHEGGASERSFDDVTVVRGVANYYYIVSVGDPVLNTGVGGTPPGPLVSNRSYTQTFDPAFLKRPAGQSMSGIRIVPNPYSISSDEVNLRFQNEPDKIAFFNIPGQCRIKIYTELGELIKEIEHTDGSGDAYWNSITSSNQVIVSGIYIVVFENTQTGERIIKKLAVIR
jgi:hypothetical protein